MQVLNTRYIVICLITGFLEKNRDTFSGDLIQLIQTTKNKYLTALFKDEFSMVCI